VGRSTRASIDWERAYEAWNGLLDSIQTGKTAFDHMHGCSLWEWLKHHAEIWSIFNEGLRQFSIAMTPAITASYDWSRFPVIADIGGGIGTQLVDILDAHPSCRGLLFEQSEVLAQAIAHDRVERMSGDFFQSVPAGADAYLLRFIIHDWNDPEASTILRNVRQATKPTSRLAVIEMVIPETPEFTFGKWEDVQMLVQTGGRERTAAEYGELYAQAGFELEHIIPTPSPVSIIIGRPRS
jgi:hypothetical protein